MPEQDDLKTHALSSAHDFYALLSVPPTASDSEIRTAYRKTARIYHPDKVGAADTAALEKFHQLQIAYDVLSDPAIRELYDNARRAREAKKERDEAFEGRRRMMKEDLERRESGAFKRKREEVEEVEAFERELRRLAEDGKRRRREREEELRKEAEEVEMEKDEGESGVNVTAATNGTESEEVSALNRTIHLRFPQNSSTTYLDKDKILALFSRFGAIEAAVLRDKKIKVEGEKHRQHYTTAVLVYQSVVGAHAAVSDFPALAKSEPETFGIFKAVGWASGKEPDFVPKPAPLGTPGRKFAPAPSTPVAAQNGGGDGLRKVPSFGSFKGTPKGAQAQGSPSLDEMTMMRLKNAERRRMEEKLRREEEASAAAGE